MLKENNVFTNPEWIPARSIHNSNKYPTELETISIFWKPFLFDLETYFQNGNHFHLILIPIERKFPNQLETVSKRNRIGFHFGNLFPKPMETVSILEIVSKPNENLCFHFGYFLGVSKMDK